jgi:hypothetical protein
LRPDADQRPVEDEQHHVPDPHARDEPPEQRRFPHEDRRRTGNISQARDVVRQMVSKTPFAVTGEDTRYFLDGAQFTEAVYAPKITSRGPASKIGSSVARHQAAMSSGGVPDEMASSTFVSLRT